MSEIIPSYPSGTVVVNQRYIRLLDYRTVGKTGLLYSMFYIIIANF